MPRKRAWIIGGLVGCLLAAGGIGIVLRAVLFDPEVVFLFSEGGARWIRVDEPVIGLSQLAEDYIAGFRRQFTLEQVPEQAVLTLRFLKAGNVLLDGETIYVSGGDYSAWKQPHRIDLTARLTPGVHELRLMVVNPKGPACALAYGNAVGLHTDETWEASRDGKTWTPSIFVDAPRVLEASRRFPRADKVLLEKAPVYLPLFLLVLSLSLWGNRIPAVTRFSVTPGTVRWVLVAAWALLGANNLFKLGLVWGFDTEQHVEYVRYVAANWRIPLASEGWQMFQSPLYYVLSVPIYLVGSWLSGPVLAERFLRILPLLSGLAQAEISYRVLRHVYPQRNDLQILGTLLGGLLPMNLYISQYASNEAPAGFLTGLTVLLALRLLRAAPEESRYRGLVWLGLSFGLALLTKLTPVLLAFPLAVWIAYLQGRGAHSIRRAVLHASAGLAIVFGVAALVSGWYYARNYVELGRPFIGGWDAARGIAWWQDPGYRTPRDLLSFGEALTYPVYATFAGFWNGNYSTFWMDAFLSGDAEGLCPSPWNFRLLLSGVWLALLPTAAMLLGIAKALKSPSEAARSGLLFAVCCIGIYLAGLLYHFLTTPFYCATKAFYTVGITSCYGAAGAAGFDLLTRTRVRRAVVYGVFACWAFAAYAGYFIWSID